MQVQRKMFKNATCNNWAGVWMDSKLQRHLLVDTQNQILFCYIPKVNSSRTPLLHYFSVFQLGI